MAGMVVSLDQVDELDENSLHHGSFPVENEFSDRFSDIPDDLISTIQAINPELESDSAALLHGDPSRINIQLEPNGLLDWEWALIGDPAFNLTEMIFHHRSTRCG